jgi:hypothetical protein
MVSPSTWWSSTVTSGDGTTVRAPGHASGPGAFRVLAVEPGDRQLIRSIPKTMMPPSPVANAATVLNIPRFYPGSAGSWRLYSSCGPSPAARSAATLARGSDGTAISTPARARSPVHPDPGSIER